MKKQIASLIVGIGLCGLYNIASAQDEVVNYPQPKWVSDRGYWTIESNIKTPENSVIYFYTNDNVLVYREKITGVKIDLKKRKVLMNLKRVLEQSVTAWETKHMLDENQMRVTIALKK